MENTESIKHMLNECKMIFKIPYQIIKKKQEDLYSMENTLLYRQKYVLSLI